jgi:HK97 family phage major capsid protein/HK97 family phage prohead protease
MITAQTIRDRADGGLIRRRLELRKIDQDKRTVEVAFASEAPVERFFGIEILRVTAEAMRLGRLRDGGAVLADHDWRAQVGVVESVNIGGDGVARGTLRFGRGQRADEIFQDIADGIRRHVSVGYIVHKIEVEAREGAPDLITVTDWEPYEVSIVAVPADTSAGVGRAAHQNEDQNMTDNTNTANTTRTAAPQNGQTQPAPAQGNNQGTDDGRRVTETLELGRQYGADAVAARILREGGGPDELRRVLLDRLDQGAPALGARGEIGMNERETRQFSLMRLVRHLAAPDATTERAAGLELEASRAFAERIGRAPQGAYVPPDVLFAPGFRRDMATGTEAAGGALVATQTLAGSFVDLLRNRLSIMDAGATMLSGLVGNIRIPRLAGGASSEWLPEAGAVSDSLPSFDTIQLSPHTIAASVPMTRRLIIQSTPDIEAVLRTELVNRVALGVDAAALNGDASANAPTGLREEIVGAATDWTAAGAPTFEEIVALETAVASATADRGNLAYLYGAPMAGHLKTAKIDAGSGAMVETPEGTVNGHPRIVTNQAQAGDVFFGNWSDVIIGMWSGLDLRVDTATLAASDGIVLRAFQDVDCGIRHAESFALGKSAA